MSEYLNDKVSDADLVSRMPDDERLLYQKYGHLRIESAFGGRFFVIYKPTGLNAFKQHRDPHVLTTVQVTDFVTNSQSGSSAKVIDQGNGAMRVIDHVPRKLFDYDIYMSIPSRMLIRWDARLVNGEVHRSLSFAVLIKTKNRSDFYSAGNTYAETPNEFLKLYPKAAGTGQFKFS